MWVVQRKLLFKLAKHFFKMGVLRSTTLPDKLLQEELDNFVSVELENNPPIKKHEEA